MIGLTYKELLVLKPCAPRRKAVAALLGGSGKWNGHKITAAQAVAARVPLSDLVWAASALARNDKDVERRLRLWLADIAEHVLPIFEKQYPADGRPRKAIAVARAFARGEISNAARAAARAAAWDAARAAARDAARDAARAAAWDAAEYAARDAARDAAWAAARAAAWDAAEYAARDAARDAAWDAARAAARDAARDAARAAAEYAARDAAWDAEEKWQLERLVAWLSDPEPKE